MNTKRSLYRDPKQGKIAGVCAGLATYFNIEVWLVRIIVLSAFLLAAGPFIFVLYIAGWLILDKKPEHLYDEESTLNSTKSNAHTFTGKGYKNANNGDEKVCVKAKVWQAGMPPKQAFLNIQQRFIRSENRLRKIESYVTSKEFQLNRELNRL
ncbi:envelope stress response membrane protein PspC [Glaciecola sp. XM2]|jgi:phage shock protein C|uniref:envelope stress response membrane protein PspC n=1 Tax=Glaciecola sp. XM2 TaxID=1914931 RepID=UPI001BDF6A74|nr:envelope stress response membrane protein PspC [Glaciecola sp. XM2]MBT1450874.1 envelope stress response membrane protein PspC [Glaciecola sp. XM2]